MKRIATLSILFAFTFYVLTYGKPNAAQVCLLTTLFAQAEVDASVCGEVKGEPPISPDDNTNLTSLSLLPGVSDRLMVRDNSELLNIDWLSNLQSIGGGILINGNNNIITIWIL